MRGRQEGGEGDSSTKEQRNDVRKNVRKCFAAILDKGQGHSRSRYLAKVLGFFIKLSCFAKVLRENVYVDNYHNVMKVPRCFIKALHFYTMFFMFSNVAIMLFRQSVSENASLFHKIFSHDAKRFTFLHNCAFSSTV